MTNLAELAVVDPIARDLDSYRTETTQVAFPERFHIVRRLGQGGMAEVFVAMRREADGSVLPVVIKRPLPELAAQAEFLNMFLDEARIASVLDHPNVAHVHEIVKRPDGCLLVLELVDGRALSALMVRGERTGRRLDTPMSAHIIARAAEGLHYAHGCQDADGRPLHIVHRDVSPQNILISFAGEAKVIDFGIAQALGRVTRTKTGARKGKSGYMAPEQVKGMPVDPRADVFGLGIVLWELLCGRRLFVRPDEYRIMNALLVDPIPRPSEFAAVPLELERIVLRALERDPKLRHSSADELRAELDAFVAAAGGVETRDIGNTVKSFFPGEGSLLEPQVEPAPPRSGRRSGPTLPTVPAIAVATAVSGLTIERRQVLKGAGALATVGVGALLASIAGRLRFRAPTAFAAARTPPSASIEFEPMQTARPASPPERVEAPAPEKAPASPPRAPAPPIRRAPAPRPCPPGLGVEGPRSKPASAETSSSRRDRDSLGRVWSEDQLADPILVSRHQAERLPDGLQRPVVRDEGSEEANLARDEVAGGRTIVVGPADLVDRQLLAPPGVHVERNPLVAGNAGEHDAPPARGDLQAGVGRARGGGTIEHHVHSPPGAVAQDGAGRFRGAGPDLGVGAHQAGELPAVRHRLDEEDPAHSGALERGHGEQADGAGPEHRRGLPQGGMGERQRVQHHRQRLDQRGDRNRQLGGQAEQILDREVDAVPKKTRVARCGKKTDARAEIVTALEAELAVIAIVSGLEGREVAPSPSAHPRAQLGHHPGRLVSQHLGIDAGHVSNPAVDVGVQIRAADPHRLHLDLHLARSGIGNHILSHAELAWTYQLGDAHGGHIIISSGP